RRLHAARRRTSALRSGGSPESAGVRCPQDDAPRVRPTPPALHPLAGGVRPADARGRTGGVMEIILAASVVIGLLVVCLIVGAAAIAASRLVARGTLSVTDRLGRLASHFESDAGTPLHPGGDLLPARNPDGRGSEPTPAP